MAGARRAPYSPALDTAKPLSDAPERSYSAFRILGGSMGIDSRLRGHGRETLLTQTVPPRLQTADGTHLGRRHKGFETADNIRRLLEQVADLYRAENQAADLENEKWGRF